MNEMLCAYEFNDKKILNNTSIKSISENKQVHI